MVKIEVEGTDPEDALGLAIWAAFDAKREGSAVSLKYNPELGRTIAETALDLMFQQAAAESAGAKNAGPAKKTSETKEKGETVVNIFQKIFEAIKHLVSRPGMKTFLAKYEKQALELIVSLAAVNNNAGFATWKDQAFAQLKQDTGDLHDNWIAILIHLAYESYKAQQEAS